MRGILEGLKVISMGQIVAIPAASSTMGDWGAEVIKLEPLTGEMHRGLQRSQGMEISGPVNWIIQVLNRSTRGLAIDLKQKAGKEALYKLIERSDVFMCNYERNSMRNLGLDYKTLSKLNPRLIYGFVSGYGKVGPDKDERGYDFTAGWARSGMMYMIGEPGTPPAPQRAGMIDSAAGAHLVSGIMAALLQRQKTGKGQEVEVSLFHTGVWMLNTDIQNAMGGKEPIKHDRTKANNPLWNSYRTKDGRWFWLAMLQPDPAWPGFCRAIDKPELEKDPRFLDIDARRVHCEELICIIEDVMASRTMAEWEGSLRKNNCIYGRVQSPKDVIMDPQALASGIFQEVEYSGVPEGKINLITSPVMFSNNSCSIKAAAPELGQHTEEILLDIGYTWGDIEWMKNHNVIL
jgi:crotonobetainyl-CoA:carnitine CoA-transferase CaiB-like acyl-CoA transferase